MINNIKIGLLLLLGLLLNRSSDDDRQTSLPVPNIPLTKTYGGSKNDSGQSITKTNDGGYIILGYSQSLDGDIIDKNNESFDYWVLKFDENHNLQWSKTYGGSDDDRGNKIIQTQDGGYAIIGYTSSNDMDVTENAGAQDYWIAKLNSMGELIWQKSYGYAGSDIGYTLLQANDGGYLITGVLDVTASGGEGNTRNSNTRHAGGDYWVLKLDNSGNLDWSRYFGGNFTDTPEGIAQTNDNGFIIAGGSDSNDTDISGNLGTYDFWVVRLSSTGELVWEKSFGGSQIDEARGIIRTDDGNFIIAGDTRSTDNDVSNNKGAADMWLVKISPDGNLIWEKTLGGSSFDVARAITKSRNNGFILAGSSRSNDNDVSVNKGQNDAWVVYVDDNGEIIWERSIGGSNIDFAYGVTELVDGTVIAVGDTTSNDGDIIENKGFTDLLLTKIGN